jgi:hypothetical protein
VNNGILKALSDALENKIFRCAPVNADRVAKEQIANVDSGGKN